MAAVRSSSALSHSSLRAISSASDPVVLASDDIPESPANDGVIVCDSMTFECTAICRAGIEVDTAAVNLGGRNRQLNQRSQGWQYVHGLDR